MDKLSWFKFTVSDWIMGKIMKCPEVTQARFIRLCCLYWNKEGNVSIEDAIIEIDEDHFLILKSKKIIKITDDTISIDFLDEQINNVAERSELRRKAVQERWNKNKIKNTSVNNNDTLVLQNDTEKRREEESREENIIITKNIVAPKVAKINIDDRINEFKLSLAPFVKTEKNPNGKYSAATVRAFFDYWSEKTIGGTKFKKERQPTWETEKRLATWSSNEGKFDKNKSASQTELKVYTENKTYINHEQRKP